MTDDSQCPTDGSSRCRAANRCSHEALAPWGPVRCEKDAGHEDPVHEGGGGGWLDQASWLTHSDKLGRLQGFPPTRNPHETEFGPEVRNEDTDHRMEWASAECIEREARRQAAEYPVLQGADIWAAPYLTGEPWAALHVGIYSASVRTSTHSCLVKMVRQCLYLAAEGHRRDKLAAKPCPVCPVSHAGICQRCQGERFDG